MTNHKDTDLREALRRRYSDTPQLSADFADRLMQRIESPKNRAKSSRFSSLSLWRGRRVRLVGIAAAAASALLLLTLHYYNNRGGELKEMPLAETQTVAADSSSNIKNEPMPTKVVEVPLVAEAKTTVAKEKTKVKQAKTMVAKERPMTAKTAKPLLAQATPTEQPQVQPQPIAEKKKSDEKVKRAEIDLKTRLHYAELELEKATHKRQAAYEQEMKQRCLQLVLTLLTPQEEEREATAGKVRTQQS